MPQLPEPIPLAWAGSTDAMDYLNFGDALSPVMVALLTSAPIERVSTRSTAARLAAVGTIGHGFAKGQTWFWGTGCSLWRNPSAPSEEREAFTIPDDSEFILTATRGPLSESLLAGPDGERPGVFGDPVWLLPRFYRPQVEKRWKLGVILHLSELADRSYEARPRPGMDRFKIPKALADDVHLITTCTPIDTAFLGTKIDEILACERIVSTSLHGMVVAESYGIPCLYFSPQGAEPGPALRSLDVENGVDPKIIDLYTGLGVKDLMTYGQPRAKLTNWSDVIDAVDRHWWPKFIDEQRLIDALPLPLNQVVVRPGQTIWQHPVISSIPLQHRVSDVRIADRAVTIRQAKQGGPLPPKNGVNSLEEGPDFIPPYPLRHESQPKPLQLLGLARKNLLSIWTVADFANRLITVKILRRKIVICNDPKLVELAFQTNHANFQRKSPQMRHALEPLIGDGLFISDGETWQKRRKIVAPIIHSSRVPGFAPTIIKTIEEKLADWGTHSEGEQIDALAEMAHLTAEIICRTIFGQELGQGNAGRIISDFSDYQRRIDQTDPVSLLGLPNWFPRYRGRGIRKSANQILAVLDEIIERFTETKETDDASVIGGLLNARNDDGSLLDPAAIRNEAAVIFMAGHETTANTLAWAWFLLSQSPRVAKRLHEELDTVLKDQPVTFADVRKLPYTKAVIEETLRLYPPVPILARETMANTKIGDEIVSKGTLLLVVPWLLHRSPNLWRNADSFRPERHLPSATGDRNVKPSKYSYVPFSIGPRICAGLAFGMTESILSLAILARRFDLQLAPNTTVQPVCRLSLRPGDRLPMTLHKRSN